MAHRRQRFVENTLFKFILAVLLHFVAIEIKYRQKIWALEKPGPFTVAEMAARSTGLKICKSPKLYQNRNRWDIFKSRYLFWWQIRGDLPHFGEIASCDIYRTESIERPSKWDTEGKKTLRVLIIPYAIQKWLQIYCMLMSTAFWWFFITLLEF